jgi:cytoskeletal protein RodZ
MGSSMTALGLENIRRRKGVSLQQIAESTKISTFFLEAIESEQFGKLPGGLFNRSYIRQYAAAVGIAADELLDNYAEYEAEKERQENPPAAPQNRRASGLRWLGSLLVSRL